MLPPRLAKLGFVNERGAEFSASSIAAMIANWQKWAASPTFLRARFTSVACDPCTGSGCLGEDEDYELLNGESKMVARRVEDAGLDAAQNRPSSPCCFEKGRPKPNSAKGIIRASPMKR
jgi:hypothetical protein